MVREDRRHVELGRQQFGLFGILLGAETRIRLPGLMSMFSLHRVRQEHLINLDPKKVRMM